MGRVRATANASNDPRDDEHLELPELDVETDAESEGTDVDGAAADDAEQLVLRLPAAGDADDGEPASELPIDLSFVVDEQGPSAVGDDETGLENAPQTLGLQVEDAGESFIEPQGEQLGLGDGGDDDIDPLPDAGDEGDADGLDDPVAEQITIATFPELDREDEQDEQEVDVGIEPDCPPLDRSE